MQLDIIEIRPTTGEKVRACSVDGQTIAIGYYADVVDAIRECFPEADIFDICVPEFIPAS